MYFQTKLLRTTKVQLKTSQPWWPLLEEITKKAMTTQVRALKTAKQMAAEAYAADESAMSSSVKKSKKVMIESSAKIN